VTESEIKELPDGKVSVSIKSRDGYSIQYLLHPPTLEELGAPYRLKMAKDEGWLIADELTLQKNEQPDKKVDILADLKGMETKLIIPTKLQHLTAIKKDKIPDSPQSEITRNFAYYATSDSSTEQGAREITMPPIVGDMGLLVFSHEKGHIQAAVKGKEVIKKIDHAIYKDQILTPGTDDARQVMDLAKAGNERLANYEGLPEYKKTLQELGFSAAEVAQQQKYTRALKFTNEALAVYGENRNSPNTNPNFFTRKRSLHGSQIMGLIEDLIA
jgi:hypothetical protein